MAHGGARCTQNPFEFQAGHYVRAVFVVIDVFQVAGIVWFAAGTQDNGADIEFQYFLLLAVINGIGQAGIHALVAFTAIATVETTGRFLLAFGLFVSQLDFGEVALAFRNGKLRHSGPQHNGLIVGNRPVAGIVVDDGFATFGHVAAFDVAQYGFGGFLAGTDGTDRHPGTGLQIASGKYAVALGGKRD